MKEMNSWKINMLLFAACLLFAMSLLTLIDKREQLRHEEGIKHQRRAQAIVLRDELRNLQLEYTTRTTYHEIAVHARRLGMQTPQLERKNFFYLPQE